jgi:glutathione S-transferase
VLLEFVADHFPNSSLLPSSPVLRAKTRFFIDAFSTKFVPASYAFIAGKGPSDGLLNAIEQLQELMAPSGFVIGDGKVFTNADAAIIPFFARMEVGLKNDLGGFEEGEGKKVWETLMTEGRFARWRKYWADVKARESFKNTFDEVKYCFEVLKPRVNHSSS